MTQKDNHSKVLILYFLAFPLSFILLYFFVHIIGLQSEKAHSQPQRDLPSPTENTAHQLLQTALS